jgi:hypothetical protein
MSLRSIWSMRRCAAMRDAVDVQSRELRDSPRDRSRGGPDSEVDAMQREARAEIERPRARGKDGCFASTARSCALAREPQSAAQEISRYRARAREE